jgi:hypothetical protein
MKRTTCIPDLLRLAMVTGPLLTRGTVPHHKVTTTLLQTLMALRDLMDPQDSIHTRLARMEEARKMKASLRECLEP